MPHVPQFALSDSTLVHDWPHAVVPVAHVSAHVPFEQTWPATHTVPQAPQFSGSLVVAEQTPLQSVWPLGQVRLGESVVASGPASLLGVLPSPQPAPQNEAIAAKTASVATV